MAVRYAVELVGEMTERARGVLDNANMIHTGSHGVGFRAPGSVLPEPNHHTVWVQADTEEAAVAEAEQTVAGLEKIVVVGSIDVDPVDF
jgi:hypothetical protein